MNTPYQPQYGPPQQGPPQGAPPQQPGPYGPPAEPQAAPGGQAAVELTARYPTLGFVYALFSPKVTVNGYRMPAAWGRNLYTVPPGQHRIDVHVNYFGFPVGKASTAVPAWPGPPVQLEYRVPWITFIGGALGPPPQQHPGRLAAALLVVAVVVIAVLVFLVAAFTA